MFYIHLQVILNNSARLNTGKQQDLQPISLLAADQLIHCKMSGSSLSVAVVLVQMEILQKYCNREVYTNSLRVS